MPVQNGNPGQVPQDAQGEKVTNSDEAPKRRTVKSFMDFMSDADQEALVRLLVIAIFASGTPLSIVENKYWVAFFAALRPCFKLPSRKTVSTTLLDRIYKEVYDTVYGKIEKASKVALMFDGWSNTRKNGVIHYIASTPSPVLVEVHEVKAVHKTAEYMAGVTELVVEKIGPEKILAVATDNAADMKKTWKLLEAKFPHLKIFYGCCAHLLHHLIDDIAKIASLGSIVDGAVTIARDVKKSSVILTILDRKQEDQKLRTQKRPQSIKLPGGTRFGSKMITLKSLIDNQYCLQQVATDPELGKSMKLATKKDILDDLFWAQVKAVFTLLVPIMKSLTQLESDSTSFSEVAQVFAALKHHFKTKLDDAAFRQLVSFGEEEGGFLWACLTERESQALTPAHFAANILDPAYRGLKLEQTDFNSGYDVIYSLADTFKIDRTTITKEMSNYTAQTGLFESELVKNSADTVPLRLYWKGTCQRSPLSRIGTALAELPPTTAAAERSFSTSSWIHSWRKNRYTTNRAGKLTFIAHNMKLFQRAFLDQAEVDKGDKRKYFVPEFDDDQLLEIEQEIFDTILELELLENGEEKEEQGEDDQTSEELDAEVD